MSGLKSGSGDDLWDEEEDEESEEDTDSENTPEQDTITEDPNASGRETSASARGDRERTTTTRSEQEIALDRTESGATSESDASQPYIVRRALKDKSVQFERDERLTFFVHRDVVEGERELASEVEAALGRDVPKFDIREAVYRAALRNPEDVLDELLKMGYARGER